VNVWRAAVYWPLWLGLLTGTFLIREIWALASGHSQDTLSDWVWRVLKITRHEHVTSWNSTDYLVCGCWIVLMSWLTWHFFFRRFT
jgi:hypothetical protein